MTGDTNDSELKHRGGDEQKSEDTSVEASKTKEFESTWQAVKYYFNRFRYYHFVVADTIDKYVSAACLLIIKWYFKLFLGVGEPASAVTEQEQ